MFFAILTTISLAARPFHQLAVENWEDDVYIIDESKYEVLDRVLVQGPKSQVPQEAYSIGGNSYLLPTKSPEESIRLARSLSKNPTLTSWPDVVVSHQATSFNDPHYEGQWYLDYLQMNQLWAATLGDPDVLIAVIDSGIDIAHPDLADKVQSPFDAFDDDLDPSPNQNEFCYGLDGLCDEHGTAVAGIAVAAANNNSGIVGMCPDCTLLPIKMLGEGQSALSSDVAAFEHCIEQDAYVINNSWGYVDAVPVPAPLESVIIRATTETRNGKGSVVVFAAGNDDREVTAQELCAIDGVICVSAIDSYGRPTAYTNYGAPIDLAAPSATVSIAPEDGLTTTFGGTSAASPVVSGLAGWIFANRPDLSAAEVTEIIVTTATPSPLVTHDSEGHHLMYGYGIIDPSSIYDRLHPQTEHSAKQGCSSLPLSPLLLPLFLFYPRRKK